MNDGSFQIYVYNIYEKFQTTLRLMFDYIFHTFVAIKYTDVAPDWFHAFSVSEAWWEVTWGKSIECVTFLGNKVVQ